MPRATDFTPLREALYARLDERDAQPARPPLTPYTRALRGCSSVEEGLEVLVARGLLPTSGVEAPGRYFYLSSAKGPKNSLLPTPPSAALFWGSSREAIFGTPLPPSLPALARTARDLSLIARSEELAREAAARAERAHAQPSLPVRVLHRLTAPTRRVTANAPHPYPLHARDFVRSLPKGEAALAECIDKVRARCDEGRDKEDPSGRHFVDYIGLLALLRSGGTVEHHPHYRSDIPQPFVGMPWSEVPDPMAPLIDAAVQHSVLFGYRDRVQGDAPGGHWGASYTAYIATRIGTDVYFWHRDP